MRKAKLGQKKPWETIDKSQDRHQRGRVDSVDMFGRPFLVVDGGVSSRLEELQQAPLHPTLWSAECLTNEKGRGMIQVSVVTRGTALVTSVGGRPCFYAYCRVFTPLVYIDTVYPPPRVRCHGHHHLYQFPILCLSLVSAMAWPVPGVRVSGCGVLMRGVCGLELQARAAGQGVSHYITYCHAWIQQAFVVYVLMKGTWWCRWFVMQAVHQEFLEAGADIITTVSYQVSMDCMLHGAWCMAHGA